MTKTKWVLTLAWMGLSLNGAVASASPATLKQVQVSGGSQIDLLFDGKVTKNQIRTEFFNDIIQISLTETSVYPAKISSINGGNLVKVFAYQYAPKLVRCRITVKGKAEDFKDRLKINTSGKIMTLKIDGETASLPGDRIQTTSAAPTRVQPGTNGDNSPAARGNAPIGPAAAGKEEGGIKLADAEERALLERVLASKPAAAPAETTPAKAAPAQKESEKAESPAPAKEAKKVSGPKPMPSFYGILAKLGFVLALFGVVAMVLKRILGGKASMSSRQQKGLMNAITKYACNGLGLGGKEKMIEVLSTHYLGPKKSISVVKVMGRVLVLGVSNDAINLITQLPDGADADLDGLDLDDSEEPQITTSSAPAKQSKAANVGAKMGYGAMAAGPALFSDLLNIEKTRPAMDSVVRNSPLTPSTMAAPAQTPAAPANTGARAQIRSRLEGLKQL